MKLESFLKTKGGEYEEVFARFIRWKSIGRVWLVGIKLPRSYCL